MLGLMSNKNLLISSLIEHSYEYHGEHGNSPQVI